MTFNPDVVVEIAFDSGYSTAAASRTWTDVSTYVEAQNAISIQRGRQDELSDVQPSRCTIVLDNKDGRFTPGYTSGANYPNVLKGRPVRVTATWSAVTYRRFLGYIDEWNVEWPDGSDGKPIVTITAASRSAILGRRTLTNIIAEEVLYDSPIAYYQMGEPAGSSSVANSAITAQPNLVAFGPGALPTFGNAIGPGTDGLTAVTFSNTTTSEDTQYLYSGSPPTTASVGDFTIEFWLSSGGTGFGAAPQYIDLWSTGNFAITQTATLNFLFRSLTLNGGALLTNTTYHVAATRSGSTVTLYVNGTSMDTGSDSTAVTLDRFIVGKDQNTSMSHVAFYTTALSGARITQHYLSGSSGFAGESSDARVSRIARWAGIASGEISAEAGATTSVGFVDYTGKSASEALLDVVHTENGILFDAGDGTFTFHARTHRYSTTSSLTLSAATQKVEADFAPKLDDQGVINDAAYTGTSGLAYRSVDTASVAAIGTYSDSAELLTTNDYEVQDRANFTTYVYGDPITRVPAASVLLTVQSSGDITSLLGLELGTQITISGLPSQAPASSMDFFIEGIAESIAFENYLMTFTLSPALASLDFWKLEVAGFGELGTTTILGY